MLFNHPAKDFGNYLVAGFHKQTGVYIYGWGKVKTDIRSSVVAFTNAPIISLDTAMEECQKQIFRLNEIAGFYCPLRILHVICF